MTAPLAAAFRPWRVGLTGGIGSGKSTVGRLLAARGALLIDTDAIARSLTLPGGKALPAIANAFGGAMLDATGALDRARMRALVFGDPQAKRRLEGILHPLISAQATAAAALAAPEQPVVFDVPLLAESAHWRARVDRVLVVDCEPPVQVQRVVARSGWAPAEVERVIAQQSAPATRRRIADAVLMNGAGVTLAALESAVQVLCTHWWGTPPTPAPVPER